MLPHLGHFHGLFIDLGHFSVGFLTLMVNPLFSFSEDFTTITIFSSDVLETNFNKRTSFLCIVSNTCYEQVIRQILEKTLFQLNVKTCILQVFMTQKLSNQQYIKFIVVEHSSFPMSQSVKWISFNRGFPSLYANLFLALQ